MVTVKLYRWNAYRISERIFNQIFSYATFIYFATFLMVEGIKYLQAPAISRIEISLW